MTDINTKKLWIIYVDNDEDHDGNIKYLTRALVKIIKLYPEDQILLLSRHVLEIDQDRLEKFVSIMEISIDKRVLWRLKSSLFGEIS